MDTHLRTAYSTQASVEVEHSARRGSHGEHRLSVLRGENLLMPVNQNVPTCVAAGTNNGCRPISDLSKQQPVFVGRTIELSWPAPLIRAATDDVVEPSPDLHSAKSMNDVGEAFFSSPLDPTDIMRDWGRSDDDQRHRLVISGTVHTSMAPAAHPGGASATASR